MATTTLPPLTADDLGTDVAVTTDLAPAWGLATGKVNLANSLFRRLTTPQGGLFYDATYGFDIRALLNSALSSASVAQARGQIAAQCMKDPRVQSVDVKLTFAGSVLTVSINVESAQGPFDLVLRASQVTVDIIRLAGQDVTTPDPRPDAVVVQVAGPKGDTGAAGTGGGGGGGGGGGAGVTLAAEAETTVTDTTETVIFQGTVNLTALAATVTATLTAMLYSAAGTSTFRLRVGGTDGVADGTVAVTLTRGAASYASATGSGTFTNPTGIALVKVTAQNATAGMVAKIKDKVVTLA